MEVHPSPGRISKKWYAPLESIITINGKVIADSLNNSKKDISHHAEMLTLCKAVKAVGSNNLFPVHCILTANPAQGVRL